MHKSCLAQVPEVPPAKVTPCKIQDATYYSKYWSFKIYFTVKCASGPPSTTTCEPSHLSNSNTCRRRKGVKKLYIDTCLFDQDIVLEIYHCAHKQPGIAVVLMGFLMGTFNGGFENLWFNCNGCVLWCASAHCSADLTPRNLKCFLQSGFARFRERDHPTNRYHTH